MRNPAGGRADRRPGAGSTRRDHHSLGTFVIFARYGWLWGGLFRGEPDYMHFEKATFGAHPNPAEAPYLVEGLHYQGQ
jgi:D-alanyl-D-alanine carboxypeptidase